MYGEHITSLQQSVRELQSAMDSLQKIVGGNPKTPKPVRVPQSHLTEKSPFPQLESPLISGTSSAIRSGVGGSQGQMLADMFSSMSRAMARNL